MSRNKALCENSEGNKTIEELQNRLRSNIESIQILSHQVSALQKENCLQKEELEKEASLRHTLQLQLESKNQLINTLTNECNHAIRKSTSSTTVVPGSNSNQHASNPAANSPSKHKFKVHIQVSQKKNIFFLFDSQKN